eukprot:scaffold15762_cov62-Attheya_sp.AAC.2
MTYNPDWYQLETTLNRENPRKDRSLKRWNYLEPHTRRNPVGYSTDAQKEKPHRLGASLTITVFSYGYAQATILIERRRPWSHGLGYLGSEQASTGTTMLSLSRGEREREYRL